MVPSASSPKAHSFPTPKKRGLEELASEARTGDDRVVGIESDRDAELYVFPQWILAPRLTRFGEFAGLIIADWTKLDADSVVAQPGHQPGIFAEAMSKPYQELVRSLVHHLGALSDHGTRIFRGPWNQVAAEFGSLRVDISDENGNTKGDSTARKERTIVIDGTDIVFWWHSKLERHQDRIYINPDRIANGGRLLVGLFARHLKT